AGVIEHVDLLTDAPSGVGASDRVPEADRAAAFGGELHDRRPGRRLGIRRSRQLDDRASGRQSVAQELDAMPRPQPTAGDGGSAAGAIAVPGRAGWAPRPAGRSGSLWGREKLAWVVARFLDDVSGHRRARERRERSDLAEPLTIGPELPEEGTGDGDGGRG